MKFTLLTALSARVLALDLVGLKEEAGINPSSIYVMKPSAIEPFYEAVKIDERGNKRDIGKEDLLTYLSENIFAPNDGKEHPLYKVVSKEATQETPAEKASKYSIQCGPTRPYFGASVGCHCSIQVPGRWWGKSKKECSHIPLENMKKLLRFQELPHKDLSCHVVVSQNQGSHFHWVFRQFECVSGDLDAPILAKKSNAPKFDKARLSLISGRQMAGQASLKKVDLFNYERLE